MECQKALLAKLIGYVIILTSLIIKGPQIAKILSSKSVEGLSPFSFYSELTIYIINSIYFVVKGSPISAYGEILIILVQNVILVLLLWYLMVNRPSPLKIAAWVTFFVAVAMVCVSLPPELFSLLPLTGLPLTIMSKIPQISINFQNGHTGQLAAVTVCLNFVGCFVRILTTIQEVSCCFGGREILLLSFNGFLDFVLLFCLPDSRSVGHSVAVQVCMCVCMCLCLCVCWHVV
ncbi:unnamed protein product [Choristocarpus tenellus]